MDIRELYSEICKGIQDHILVIDFQFADSGFASLLNRLNISRLRITACSAEFTGNKIVVLGLTNAVPSSVFRAGNLTIEICEKNGRLKMALQINTNGNVMLADLCNHEKTVIDDASIFKNFIICSPVITVQPDEIGYRISGIAQINNRNALDERLQFIADTMAFSGTAHKVFGIICFSLDFYLNGKTFRLPFGNAEAVLSMRTLSLYHPYERNPKAYAYILFALVEDSFKGLVFQMDITDPQSGCYYAAAFPADSVSSARESKYLKNMPLFPQLPDFGPVRVQKIALRVSPENNDIVNGLHLDYAALTLALQKPLDIPVFGMQFTEFTIFSETTYYKGRQLSSFSVSCAASVKLGKYTVSGRIKGYYPQKYYEGMLSLVKSGDVIQNKEGAELTLADMAAEFNCPVPSGWGKPLAEFSVTADAGRRSCFISACADGIIEIETGILKISLDSIGVQAEIMPSEKNFSFNGIFGFDAGGSRFQISFSAQYHKRWSFSGGLVQGQINLVDLFAGLFHIQVAESRAKICIDGLSVEVTPSLKEFKISSSFYAECFSIFGTTPRLGGRVKIEKRAETEAALYASALFYFDVGMLSLLVQADDFYTDNVTYLFRLSFHKLYLQGIYYKENNDEIVKFQLGGMTFGDIVLAFIHLINPNAKSYLSAPWNILNKINLSNFSIVINATQKTASVIYSVNLSIAGLMQIHDIGIRYSSKNGGHKIDYILTGKLPGRPYGSITWDAVDGAPPADVAAAETKTKVSYIGLASHLDIEISSSSIEEAVAKLKEQLTPAAGGVPGFAYSESIQWLFGADFTLGNMFNLKTALIDPHLYGAKFTVSVKEDSPLYYFNGLELELVYQKISSSTGMFRCTVVLPKSMSRMDFGAAVIMLGQISLELYTNGSFYIDLGFPHNGIFSKSFGLEYGIFTGRGGIYFGTLKGDAVKNVPVVTNGAFSPVVLMGIGLCVGIGRSFDFGIIKGGLSLTVTGILEGVFALFNPAGTSAEKGMYYLVSAAAGVSGTLFLSADLKIISISVSAAVRAVCLLTLESCRKSIIKLSLYLKLCASIKILFIKINFSFTFDKTVEFTFGKDSQTPWTLENKKAPEAPAFYDLEMFPCKELGHWEIKVSVLPLFSVKNLKSSDALQYCAAFLCAVQPEDFSKLSEMLFEWLLASFKEAAVITRDMAASIPEKAEEALSFGDFDGFFQKNLHITAEPETESSSGNDLSGVFFPMLHCLRLACGEAAMDFSGYPVTRQYCQMIGEYLARLNSDPLHRLTELEHSEESIPICAEILADYFKMILAEFISLLKSQFEYIPVEAQSFSQLSSRYEISAEELLEQNTGLLLDIHHVPKLTCTLREGDTLKSLCDGFSVSEADLWNEVKNSSMIPRLGQSVTLNHVPFDNRSAGMTFLEAAAVFFVRLYNPDVIYLKYAEKIVSDNHLSSDWESKTYGSCRLDVPGWSGRYTALAGDSCVRIAKTAAIINGEAADGWESFLGHFKEKNPKNAEFYYLDGEYVISDNTLEELNLRLFPDSTDTVRQNCIWEQPVLSPLKTIEIKNAELELTSVTAGQTGISVSEIAAALEAGTAELSTAQTVSISPASHTKAELRDLVLTEENVSRIGAMISRFFLQGLRIPAENGDITPLFELLGQQIDVRTDCGEFVFSIEKNHLECGWADVSEHSTASLGKEAFSEALPGGELPAALVPEKAADFSQISKCWSAEVEILLQNGIPKNMCVLPEDMCAYLERYGADTVETLDKREFEWACLTKTGITKAGKNIYHFSGASPEERQKLYRLLSGSIENIHILRKTSKFDTGTAEYAEIMPEACMLIRTNLSTETHYEALPYHKELQNIAYINEPEHFLLFVWECSVIGGGFSFYCTDIPDDIFHSDGTADIFLLAAAGKTKTSGGCINRALFHVPSSEKPVFAGTAEKEYVPNYPAGSAGIYAAAKQADSSMEELFSVMGYTIGDADGAVWESMPLLPQQNPDGAFYYHAAVPLYRLCGDRESPYNAVGVPFTLNFFRRDVLGNRFELGSLEMEAGYNDYLMTMNQIPCTETRYSIQKHESGVQITVTSNFVFSAGMDSEQAKAAAQTAMRQAECDIEIRLSSSLGTAYTLTAEELSAYRNFTCEVYSAVCKNNRSGVNPFSVSFCADSQHFPARVFEIELLAEIKRKNAGMDYAGIASAECVILREEEFEKHFENALPEILLAAGGSKLYGIPRAVYFEEISVSPFSLNAGQEQILSPRFYSAAPFSRSLITRTAEVTQFNKKDCIEVEFADIDIELWIKRFLSDIENLLDGEILSNAAVSCPESADNLIHTKKSLAECFSNRLSAVIDGFSGDDKTAARECAVQLFLKSLENVYDTDVFCVYKADIKHAENVVCRMEGALEGADGLCGQKIDSQKKYFCVYSAGAQKHSNEQVNLSMSLLHFEYDIEPGTYGYESSKWLRLLSPFKPEHMNLRAGLGIPHPLKLFPDSPKLVSQGCSTHGETLLRYGYSVKISCKCYEQRTLYLRLRFSGVSACRSAAPDHVFDILADYSYNRQELLQHISAADKEFSNAYKKMAETAYAFAGAIAEKNAGPYSEPQYTEIILKICFKITDAATAECEVYGAESRAFVDKYGITVNQPLIVSGGEYGSDTVLQASLSNLPVYICPSVEPSAWITQNENLFPSGAVKMNEEFLFHTESVFLNPLYIHAEYAVDDLTAEDIRQAACHVWELLELSGSGRYASVSAVCCFRVDTLTDREIFTRIPAVFLPKVQDCADISDALKVWLDANGTGILPAAVTFRVNVFGGRAYDSPVSAEISVKITNHSKKYP